MKKIIYFFFIGFVLINLSACFSPNGELTGRKTTRLDYTIADPLGMQPIPGGSFTMGANDQDVPYASMNNMRTITVSPFFIDATEITNDEYRQFTHWVRDSIIRKELLLENPEKWGFINDPDPNWNQDELSNEQAREEDWYIDWYQNLNFQNQEVTRAMINTLILPEEDQMQQEGETVLRPHFQSKLIDTRKLIYEYTWFNPNTPASRVNRYDYDKEDYREVERAEAFVSKERV
ncbi:MAG: hypothetical protein CMD26_00005, partial [Flavobacteriales bacterium]|nr:hypothetical protein [Flavobacteriales bacterium]